MSTLITIGYIFNIVAFIGMIIYIKSIKYCYKINKDYRTIKLRIISWYLFLIMGLIPYLGLLVYPIAATFLIQSKIEDDRYNIIYTNTYKRFTNIGKILFKPFDCIFNFLDKEI